ncbi:TetR/AcrR family transcriptional regulator, partial [Streptomyces tricolor]
YPRGTPTSQAPTPDERHGAGLRPATVGFGGVLAELLPEGGGRSDLAADLARALGQWLAGGRTGVELEYELYLAALRRPALRPVAAEWTDAAAALLARRTDPVTARALLALMDGICLQVLLTGGSYDEEHARAVLARLIP